MPHDVHDLAALQTLALSMRGGVMANVDYLEVKGPASLAELVAAIDPAAAASFSAATAPPKTFVTLSMGRDEWAQVQYDAVDDDTWPYMITIESRTDDEAPVRAQSTRMFDVLTGRGWRVQLTSDFDETFKVKACSIDKLIALGDNDA